MAEPSTCHGWMHLSMQQDWVAVRKEQEEFWKRRAISMQRIGSAALALLLCHHRPQVFTGFYIAAKEELATRAPSFLLPATDCSQQLILAENRGKKSINFTIWKVGKEIPQIMMELFSFRQSVVFEIPLAKVRCVWSEPKHSS